jgi:hypothetical protein
LSNEALTRIGSKLSQNYSFCKYNGGKLNFYLKFYYFFKNSQSIFNVKELKIQM